MVLIYRSRLGPDLVFVILDMELEQQVKRIRSRHEGDEDTVEMMKVDACFVAKYKNNSCISYSGNLQTM